MKRNDDRINEWNSLETGYDIRRSGKSYSVDKREGNSWAFAFRSKSMRAAMEWIGRQMQPTPPTREEYERIAALLNSKLTSAKIVPWEETQYAKEEK